MDVVKKNTWKAIWNMDASEYQADGKNE